MSPASPRAAKQSSECQHTVWGYLYIFLFSLFARRNDELVESVHGDICMPQKHLELGTITLQFRMDQSAILHLCTPSTSDRPYWLGLVTVMLRLLIGERPQATKNVWNHRHTLPQVSEPKIGWLAPIETSRRRDELAKLLALILIWTGPFWSAGFSAMLRR